MLTSFTFLILYTENRQAILDEVNQEKARRLKELNEQLSVQTTPTKGQKTPQASPAKSDMSISPIKNDARIELGVQPASQRPSINATNQGATSLLTPQSLTRSTTAPVISTQTPGVSLTQHGTSYPNLAHAGQPGVPVIPPGGHQSRDPRRARHMSGGRRSQHGGGSSPSMSSPSLSPHNASASPCSPAYSASPTSSPQYSEPVNRQRHHSGASSKSSRSQTSPRYVSPGASPSVSPGPDSSRKFDFTGRQGRPVAVDKSKRFEPKEAAMPLGGSSARPGMLKQTSRPAHSTSVTSAKEAPPKEKDPNEYRSPLDRVRVDSTKTGRKHFINEKPEKAKVAITKEAVAKHKPKEAATGAHGTVSAKPLTSFRIPKKGAEAKKGETSTAGAEPKSKQTEKEARNKYREKDRRKEDKDRHRDKRDDKEKRKEHKEKDKERQREQDKKDKHKEQREKERKERKEDRRERRKSEKGERKRKGSTSGMSTGDSTAESGHESERDATRGSKAKPAERTAAAPTPSAPAPAATSAPPADPWKRSRKRNDSGGSVAPWDDASPAGSPAPSPPQDELPTIRSPTRTRKPSDKTGAPSKDPWQRDTSKAGEPKSAWNTRPSRRDSSGSEGCPWDDKDTGTGPQSPVASHTMQPPSSTSGSMPPPAAPGPLSIPDTVEPLLPEGVRPSSPASSDASSVRTEPQQPPFHLYDQTAEAAYNEQRRAAGLSPDEKTASSAKKMCVFLVTNDLKK